MQRLVSFLTTPSAGPDKSNEEVVPITTNVESIPRLTDYDSDDTPSVRAARITPADTRTYQHEDTDPRPHPRPKAKPRSRSRRVSEEQSQVDSAELLWYVPNPMRNTVLHSNALAKDVSIPK